ncbi:DUF4192 family protein [Isoptericola sp. F-RaC21]|uniref:DUF4192 family protein n=1 Tax=Isoptericola sp. F-RaC21 TaxID=3141452 RepID=UPI00315BEF5F
MDAAYSTDRAGASRSALEAPLVLRSSRDLLAAVPYLLGFRPRECVVVVAVTAEGQIGLVARTALAELADGSGAGGTAGMAADVDAVARAASRVGARLALVVLYTSAPPGRARAHAAAVVGALDESLAPTVDVEAWLVGPQGYRGLDCVDPACCPPQGRPVSELEHGEVGAAFVVAGRAIAASEEEAHRIRRPSDGVRDRVAKAAARAQRARAAASEEAAAPRVPEARAASGSAGRRGPGRADALGRWRAEAYEVWRDLVRQAAAELCERPATEVELAPARLGRLAVALADVPVRDAVLLSLVPGGREVADRTAGVVGPGTAGGGHGAGHGTGLGADGGADGGAGDGIDVEAATARAIARVVDPRVGVPPDAATADAARVVLEQLVGGAPRRWHAAPLALLGFLAWWRGDGWLAARRVRESARQDPGHRLAALLAGVLEAAVPPGWVSSTRQPVAAGVARPTVG